MFDDLKRTVAHTPKQEEELLLRFGQFSGALKMLDVKKIVMSKTATTTAPLKEAQNRDSPPPTGKRSDSFT